LTTLRTFGTCGIRCVAGLMTTTTRLPSDAQLARHHSEARALKTLREELESDTAARDFVSAIGISEGSVLHEVFGHLCKLLEGWVSESEVEEAVALTEHLDAMVVRAALHALGAFDTEGVAEDRRYRINPLLGQMWHCL
jgi:hypothetical protein